MTLYCQEMSIFFQLLTNSLMSITVFHALYGTFFHNLPILYYIFTLSHCPKSYLGLLYFKNKMKIFFQPRHPFNLLFSLPFFTQHISRRKDPLISISFLEFLTTSWYTVLSTSAMVLTFCSTTIDCSQPHLLWPLPRMLCASLDVISAFSGLSSPQLICIPATAPNPF